MLVLVFLAVQSVKSKDELELALTEASMPNKTLIIAVINKAYVESVNEDGTMLDLLARRRYQDTARPSVSCCRRSNGLPTLSI
ncbi:hypothetical protein V6N13_003174 [Hibiscus sabdariffa]